MTESLRSVPLGSTPFGAENRRKLIADFFSAMGKPTASSAWLRVYGLLLWIDASTGLAHCYESDKSQPGKPWYARSLAFHAWLAKAFGCDPITLKDSLDWLFHRALAVYLLQIESLREAQQSKGASERSAFKPTAFPLPGTDPEMEKIILEVLAPYFAATPPPEVLERLGQRLREYWKQENKRKNLLGEGFEDVLAETISAIHPTLKVRTRTSVAGIHGFYAPGAKDKATKVDLVIEHPRWPRPALVNVKWSVRADREDQLWDDFQEYIRFDRDGRGFDHYLLTNEFDPARLNALCDRRQANSHVFKHVVHISTAGLLSAYGSSSTKSDRSESSFSKVARQIESKRLISLSDWLETLAPKRAESPSPKPKRAS